MIFNGITMPLGGKEIDLSIYQNQLTLVVNTASQCGLTPQYRGLETLYKKYKEYGFTVLGFPCNQFGQQEPHSNEEIQHFCDRNYQISFPIFDKTLVNGPKTNLLYQRLKQEAPGLLGSEQIKWNFTKFLVKPSGQVTRYAPTISPAKLDHVIEAHFGLQRRQHAIS